MKRVLEYSVISAWTECDPAKMLERWKHSGWLRRSRMDSLLSGRKGSFGIKRDEKRKKRNGREKGRGDDMPLGVEVNFFNFSNERLMEGEGHFRGS